MYSVSIEHCWQAASLFPSLDCSFGHILPKCPVLGVSRSNACIGHHAISDALTVEEGSSFFDCNPGSFEFCWHKRPPACLCHGTGIGLH